MITTFFDQEIFQWVILPILIFLARICDQTIGTLRLVFLSKGFKILAPILGFFEVIIWILAVGQILKHMDNFLCYIAYGGGFATGNYIGLIVEERLSIGNVIIRIITKNDAFELIADLQRHNFGTTIVNAEGSRGEVKIIFSIIKRTDSKKYISIINSYDPSIFYSIEDVKSVKEGIFRQNSQNSLGYFYGFFRKSK